MKTRYDAFTVIFSVSILIGMQAVKAVGLI